MVNATTPENLSSAPGKLRLADAASGQFRMAAHGVVREQHAIVPKGGI